MATLFLTCGLPGSGKTTLARQLERERAALRLTADEWLHDLYPGLSGAELDRHRDAVERIQWATAVRALELGTNVVLDWGLWSRQERNLFREQARTLGARVVLCALHPTPYELRRRLRGRNRERQSGTFQIDDAKFTRAFSLFQQPTDEELALFDPL